MKAVRLAPAADLAVDGDRWSHGLMTTPPAVGAIAPDTDLSLPPTN